MVDVLNDRKLKKLGYNPKQYYCGNYGFQKYYTKLRNNLEKLGIPFPFNKACFLHDLAYSNKPTIWQKVKIDFKFLLDMITILNNSKSKKRRLKKEF